MLAIIPESLSAFIADDDGRPVVMLNLLRFKPEGGRERYAEYLAAVGPVGARFGIEVVYFGDGLAPLSAEAGQAWDAVLLVRYPDRDAFVGMIGDPEYVAAAGPVREDALLEAVLQPLRTRD
jgi:hypothetical protein